MIHNLKKIRILDSIILREDLELIKHRISNSYPYVDWILLILPENKFDFTEVETHVSQWADKISYFFTKDFEKIFNQNNKNDFYQFLKSLNLNFEDVICFSEISELPNYRDFKTVSEQLVFEPIILRNINLIFNLTKQTKGGHMGSLCTNYSMILNRPDILLRFNELKNRDYKDDFNVIDNGFNFEFFQPKEKMVSEVQKFNSEIDEKSIFSIISQALSPTYLKNGVKLYFTDFESQIDFDVNFLKQYYHNREVGGKVLVIFNMYQIKIEEDLISAYDRIFNFNFGNDYNFREIKEFGRLETVNIFLPKKPMYDSREYNFNLFFALKETKKILKKSNLQNEQVLDILVLEKGNDSKIQQQFFWWDLKNKDFIETFYKKLVPYI